jgi:hypothetical protein
MFFDDGPQRNDRYISGGNSVTLKFSMQFLVSSFTSMNQEGAKLLTTLVFRKRSIGEIDSRCPFHWQCG